jgi:hypothetical protein
MKKAQLFAQPIFFIFILVVASLILIFGIKTIFNIKEKAELAELATSIQDLRKTVSSYYSFDYGSAREINIRFPNKIEYICFTNHNPKPLPEIEKYGEVIKLFKLSKYNTFILPASSFKTNAFTIDHLTVKEDPLCIQNKGTLKAIVTNVGDSVEISKSI